MKLRLEKNLPVIVIILLASVPIIRWFFLEPLNYRFLDINSFTTSLGQITGLLGMLLFSVNLILSNRLIFFDTFFSGLHHSYNIHKWLGTLSFSLLLFHPLFLVVKYISISLQSAAMFLLPNGYFPVTLGIIALFGMIVLICITFYLKIKYHIWKFSHKFLVLVFVFAILHTILISSDISRDLFLRYYIIFFAMLGLISGIHRSFLRFLFNYDFKYKVIGTKIFNNNVIEIELESNGKSIGFYPGQFIFIKFISDVKGISRESHPFSVSSSLLENNLKITVKSLGDFTNNLINLNVGAKVKIEGPFGKFFENRNPNKKEIWIAGGVGITPFLSLIRSIKPEDCSGIDLYYCLKNNTEAFLFKELEDISRVNNKFRLIPWCSDDKGYINADIIYKLSGDLKDKDIYLCGPPSFMKILTEQFIKIGVDSNNIHFEEFNFL
ncbi:MAG: ferric reductase-like transmembrane domain-containing protein [Minisyncoccia bacterium]